MNLHHHHTFQFDDDHNPVYFNGVLVHDHDDEDHWIRQTYHITHKPLDGYIEDGDCMDKGSGFECPWPEWVERIRETS